MERNAVNPDNGIEEDSGTGSAFETYIGEVSGLERLSSGEREAAFLNSMAGDTDAQKLLAKDFLPDVVDLAKLYAGQGVDEDELVSQGNEALVEGVRLLSTFQEWQEAESALVRMIMNSMEDLISEEGEFRENASKIADRVNLVSDCAESIYRETGLDAGVSEVAEKLGVDVDHVTEAFRLSGFRIAHLKKPEESGE